MKEESGAKPKSRYVASKRATETSSPAVVTGGNGCFQTSNLPKRNRVVGNSKEVG